MRDFVPFLYYIESAEGTINSISAQSGEFLPETFSISRKSKKKDSLGGSLLVESDRDIKAKAGEMHWPGHNLVCCLAAGCIDAGNFAHLSCFCP